MKKTVLLFGSLVFALLLLFQISKYSILTGSLKTDFVIAAIAFIFFLIGVYSHAQNSKKKESKKEEVNLQKVAELELSKREYEVLKEISIGLSNQEIADKLFLSESTIKTHVSNVLLKLNAKRRTQAVQIAKELHII
jgi:DNA-binding NarL/FixJ family response regulator